MTKKYHLSEKQIEAIQSLSDSELEKLHLRSGEELINKDNQATDLFNQVNQKIKEDPTEGMLEKILLAAEGFKIAAESNDRWRAINAECFRELTRRNLRKKREE